MCRGFGLRPHSHQSLQVYKPTLGPKYVSNRPLSEKPHIWYDMCDTEIHLSEPAFRVIKIKEVEPEVSYYIICESVFQIVWELEPETGNLPSDYGRKTGS